MTAHPEGLRMKRLPSSIRKFARIVRGDGWTAEIMPGGHIRFRHPQARGTVTASASSNDRNKERILLREMRRALEGAAE